MTSQLKLFPVNNIDSGKLKMQAISWSEGLSSYGNYYAGIVEESNLDKIQLHKRDTTTTFGT